MVNKLKKLPREFKDFLVIASVLSESIGFKIYLVGGVVRDLLLNRGVFDLDIVVEGDAIIFAQKLAHSMQATFKKHHVFGTATVYFGKHKIDFATARREYYSYWGALPKVKIATMKEDMFRRDFTINAMAISLNKANYGVLIDFYNGLSDLKHKVIRVMHPVSFLEDPTRILRAIRFEQRFSFKIEKETAKLMKEAVETGALKFVHPHRLRDELILILKELHPARYIKRIGKLAGFSFLSSKIKLIDKDYRLFLSIEKAISFYNAKFKRHRKLEDWLIYLAEILIKLSSDDIMNFLRTFDFKKSERIRILSIKKNLPVIKKLNKLVYSHTKNFGARVYRILNPFSFECILFFYAYYPQRRIRFNIEYFWDELIHTRLKVKGEDLKRIGLEPHNLYSKLLDKLLYAKIDKNLKTKKEEIGEAKRIFKNLTNPKNAVAFFARRAASKLSLESLEKSGVCRKNA